MEKTDSTTAMASLIAHYTESDRSEDEDDTKDVADDKISDDEDEKASRTDSIHGPIALMLGDDDNNSRSSLTRLDLDKTVESRKRKVPTKLVSYRGDDYDSDRDDASSDVDIEDGVGFLVKGSLVDYNVTLTSETHDVSSLSRSVLNLSDDEIQLPPEPPGRCAKHLQDKIAKLHERMQREGLSLSRTIQRKKEVRNPSIYEKLIDFCNIDEKGTNYPPELYDPHSWDKDSYYDALDKRQKTEMEKREKERKERTKVEFVVATKKSTADHLLDEKKRKSKWDALPGSGSGSGSRTISSTSNPGASSGTASATGTKTTIISAVGNIMKKSK